MPPRKGDRIKDLTGVRSGRLLVTGFAGYTTGKTRERVLWNCLCDCGKETTATTDEITQQTKQSCGCLQHETRVSNGKKRHIDLVGQHIYEWYVKERVEDRISKSDIHAVQYLCVCSCGEEAVVLATTLLSGNSHDCGHSRRKKLSKLLTRNMTGMKIGEWTVQYKLEGVYPSKWHCICSCGVEKDIYQSSLAQNDTVSCGHLRMSHGEYWINEFLKENNIEFIFDRTMPNLLSHKGGHLRVDFQLFQNDNLVCVIEYQGEQHYTEANNEFWKIFGKQQREVTDDIKRKYCKDNNIPLHEIRHSKYKSTIIKNLIEILIMHNLIQGNTVPSSQETA